MRIYLVRHAQSNWQLQASPDRNTELTAVGHHQAKLLAQWLAAHPTLDHSTRIEIVGLCSSPYKRAQETIKYTSDALGSSVSIFEELREADFHVADDLPSMTGPRQAPQEREHTDRYAAFRIQVKTGLEKLITEAEATGGPILAVTHGGFIKTLFRLVLGSDAVCFIVYNAAINAIEWRRGRWHLVYLNLSDHLPAEFRTC